MARLPKKQLLEKVEKSLASTGWNVLLLSGVGEHPARFRVFRDEEKYTLRVYIWNVTHGGGAARAAHEYRIQITGVEQFEAEPGGRTLILGWYDDAGVFAAFDYNFHQARLGASPSFQIGEQALAAAAENGLAPYNRGNGELAIAVRPDVLGIYIQNMIELHATGAVGAEVEVLTRLGVDPTEVEAEEVENIVAQPRQRAVLTTVRLLRDIRFRGKVLNAYRHRCAFCGIQLNLLDAAHILPVGHPDSTDRVNNGVALCALHHRAYDRALVTFDVNYGIILSDAEVANLRATDRADGLEAFQHTLLENMLLPRQAGERPLRQMVSAANRLRGWELAD